MTGSAISVEGIGKRSHRYRERPTSIKQRLLRARVTSDELLDELTVRLVLRVLELEAQRGDADLDLSVVVEDGLGHGLAHTCFDGTSSFVKRFVL